MRKSFLALSAVISSLSIFAFPSFALETRCGWLANPTPANWLLFDADGRWIISAQGGYQAQGMQNMPAFDSSEYVKTNVNYGYGCACLEVEVDYEQMNIQSIQGGEVLPLSMCQAYPNLSPMR